MIADECHGALDLPTESLDFTHGFSWTLHLSERTVESHRASAYRKLKVKNVGDLQQLLSALESEEREQERSLKEVRQTKFR